MYTALLPWNLTLTVNWAQLRLRGRPKPGQPTVGLLAVQSVPGSYQRRLLLSSLRTGKLQAKELGAP